RPGRKGAAPAGALPGAAAPRGGPGGAERAEQRRGAAHAQPVLPRLPGRRPADESGSGGGVLLDRFGLFERLAAAVPGAASDEGAGGGAALGHALQPEPVADRGGSGRGGAADCRGSGAAATE